ncbi:uncharacterized protein METZ01_LOCUS156559 [marine metagenome]|uniref:Uncharacterized protein n=1 Tax=marine metagenome TaxID=408172 RepID=A0A382AQ92_9ZZZZ
MSARLFYNNQIANKIDPVYIAFYE